METFDSSDGSSSEEEEHETTRGATDAPDAEASRPNGQAAPNESVGNQRQIDSPFPTSNKRPFGLNSHTCATRVWSLCECEYVSQCERVQQGPFGLPTELRLAALAQRRDRTLRARSDRYLYTLATVAVFYALPVVQFVAVVQMVSGRAQAAPRPHPTSRAPCGCYMRSCRKVLNVSGSLDICYYNFLCAHPAGALSDFNHVLSNAGYLLLGALFLLQVRRRRARRRRQPRHQVGNHLQWPFYKTIFAVTLIVISIIIIQDYGIPAHYGLLSALGAAMMVVAVLSASYHVCPNRLNFQFGTLS